MATDGKTPKREALQEDVHRRDEEVVINVPVPQSMSPEELRKSNDSIIENIGALRFSINTIERLEGYRALFRDLLADCRIPLEAHGHKALVREIDKLLKDTAE